MRSAITRLHNSATAAGHNSKSRFTQHPRQASGFLVIKVIFFRTGRTENTDGFSIVHNKTESIHKLGHNSENPPQNRLAKIRFAFLSWLKIRETDHVFYW